MDQLLKVLRYTVRNDRIVADVELAKTCPHNTSPALIARLRADYLHLPHHACVNDKGTTFGAVINDTPLPHLLEHMVVDLQVRASDGSQTFVGTSEWVCEKTGRARIEISFADDLVALAAFRDAVEALNVALEQEN